MKKIIDEYEFVHDLSKPGRDLESVKVGKVYVSRLTIAPGVVTGNIYHKKSKVLLMVTSGEIRFKFVQVNTGEEKSFVVTPDSGVIHVPPYVAIADKNIGQENAVVIYFSNYPFRKDDDYKYKVY